MMLLCLVKPFVAPGFAVAAVDAGHSWEAGTTADAPGALIELQCDRRIHHLYHSRQRGMHHVGGACEPSWHDELADRAPRPELA